MIIYPPIPNSGPKFRLLEAAEKLFADRGFEAVSVRDITKEAGANVAAVNYHFGSRDGLIGAVIKRYLGPVMDDRLARLDAEEKKWPGKVVPVEAILNAYIRPLAELVRKSELSERLYGKLLGRIFGEQGHTVPEDVDERVRLIVDRYGRAFARALPDVPLGEMLWRLHFIFGSLIHMLINEDALHRLSGGAADRLELEASIDRLVAFAAAGLRQGGTESAIRQDSPQKFFDF